MLVAVRTFALSPFPQDAAGTVYFGGFDANFRDALDTAWILRATGELIVAARNQTDGPMKLLTSHIASSRSGDTILQVCTRLAFGDTLASRHRRGCRGGAMIEELPLFR